MLPVALEKRAMTPKRCAEAYLLQNTRKGSYVAGCSSVKHPRYLLIIETLQRRIMHKHITTIGQAQTELEKLITCTEPGTLPESRPARKTTRVVARND